MPTQPQIQRLYTLAHAAGLDHAGVHKEILQRYGVESTTELADRHYGEYCRDLKGRGSGRPSASAPRPTPAGNARLSTREQCRDLLAAEWPELLAERHRSQLAADLADCLDSFRLYRTGGAISAGILRAVIQRLRRLPYDQLAQAAEVYLERYTSRDERYFEGICRRMQRDARRAAALAKRPKPVPATPAAAAQHAPPPPPRPALTPEDIAEAEQWRKERAARHPDTAAQIAALEGEIARYPAGHPLRTDLERQLAKLREAAA